MSAAYGDLVEVVWVDHVFYIGAYSGDNGLVTISSVGYLVKHDDEDVIIAQTWGIDADPYECLHLIAGCVVEVRKLKPTKVHTIEMV